MRSTTRARIVLLLVAALTAGCAASEAPPDEATLRAFPGREATPQELSEAPRAAAHLGALADLAPPAGGLVRKHAALLRVRYPGGPGAA